MPLAHEHSRVARSTSASTSRAASATTGGVTSSNTSSSNAPVTSSRPPFSSRHHISTITAPTASSAAKAVAVRSSSRLRQASTSQPDRSVVPSAPLRRAPSSRIRSQQQPSRGPSTHRESSPAPPASHSQVRANRAPSSASGTISSTARSRSRARSAAKTGTYSSRTASITAKSRPAAISTATSASTTTTTTSSKPPPLSHLFTIPLPGKAGSKEVPAKKGTAMGAIMNTHTAALATPPSSAVSILELQSKNNDQDSSRENIFRTSLQDSNASESDDHSFNDSGLLGVQSSLPRTRHPTRRRGRGEDGSLGGPTDGRILDFGFKICPPTPSAPSPTIQTPPQPRAHKDRELREQQQHRLAIQLQQSQIQAQQQANQRQQLLQRHQQHQHTLKQQERDRELVRDQERRQEMERLRMEQEAQENEARESRNQIIDEDGDFRVPEFWVNGPDFAGVEIGGVSPPAGIRSAKMRNSLGDDEDALQEIQDDREGYMTSIQEFKSRQFTGTIKDLNEALTSSLKAKALSLDNDSWLFEGD